MELSFNFSRCQFGKLDNQRKLRFIHDYSKLFTDYRSEGDELRQRKKFEIIVEDVQIDGTQKHKE